MSSSRVSGLWLISLAAFSSMASMRVCDPMLVALATEFQVSVGEASRVISAFAVAYGCLQLFYGPLGDRVGKLRVINAAALACAVFSAMTAMASDFHLLVIARAAMGASAADVTGDGKLDLVAAAPGTNTVAWLAGKGDGGFAAPVASAVRCSSMRLLEMMSVNTWLRSITL